MLRNLAGLKIAAVFAGLLVVAGCSSQNRPDILVDEKQVYTYVNLIIPFKEMIDQLLQRRQALATQIAGG